MRVLAIILIAISPAAAHDWYENKTDPVTVLDCCGSSDCHPIPDSAVRPKPDGGYIYKPHSFNIPPNRVQKSEDGRYHICMGQIKNYRHTEWNWYCFFAPEPLTN